MPTEFLKKLIGFGTCRDLIRSFLQKAGRSRHIRVTKREFEMLKTAAIIVGGSLLTIAILFSMAGRSTAEIVNYFKAGAASTVKSIEAGIATGIHDEKTEAELSAAEDQLIDRRVQLNLSQNQLKKLGHEIADLESGISDRSHVLGSAYPLLQSAMQQQATEVKFVSTHFTLEEFQQEIDQLLSVQQRDEETLQVKRAGYQRLQQSVADGETALLEMKNEVLKVGQEFAVLKSRREQARMESDTLDLLAGVTAGHDPATANLGGGIGWLVRQVEKLEARNAARRDGPSIAQREATGKLTRSFNRLETLKKYTTKTIPTSETATPGENEAVGVKAGTGSLSDAAEEVVIHINCPACRVD